MSNPPRRPAQLIITPTRIVVRHALLGERTFSRTIDCAPAPAPDASRAARAGRGAGRPPERNGEGRRRRARP